MWTVSGALHNIIIKYLTKLETGFEGQRRRWRRRHLFQFSLFILYHLIWRTFKRFISSGHCGHIEYLSSINSMHCFTYIARRGGGKLARKRVSWHTHLAIYDFDWSSTAQSFFWFKCTTNWTTSLSVSLALPFPFILSVCPTLCLIFRPCWLMNRTCKLIFSRFLNFFFLVWLIWGRFCDVLVPLSVADICKPLNCFISLPFTVLSLSFLLPQNSPQLSLSPSPSLSPSSFVA